MEAIPDLADMVRKRRRGRKGYGFPRLTRWYCRKKPPHLEQKFIDETSEQQVDDKQVNAQEGEVDVEDEQVDTHQGVDNQNDEEQ
ncbi:hypothetical protein LWI28_010505 [Acer negundo]|uniref:Uncharacterized protein n=1 Tax=Acer negundo TaxID=4023 RepID=A0AAD5I9Z6_ACENE|nr:hypothetical protein LWI28_010505 [Acer negundo]